MIGDGRPYNTALVVLDADFAPAWPRGTASRASRWRSWPTRSRCVAAVQEAVDKGNAELARVEQIKKFTIVARRLAPGGDELTPTMKLSASRSRRSTTAEIEAMYAR